MARIPALLFVACVITLAAPPDVLAQQPFLVDDADVTPAWRWHVELSSQADALRPSARPLRWQNAFEWEVDYGVGPRLELGVLMPVISLVSDRSTAPRVASGIGDTTVAAKYRIAGDAAAPASYAASLSLEVPTGSRSRQFGSGLVDYGLNLVAQYRVGARSVLRLNGGAVLAGNTLVGAVGIAERGAVLTTGASLVRAFTPRLQLGGELTMAWSQRASFGGSAIGWLAGGNLAVRDNVTLDLGVLGGWLDASPRFGLQIGTSIDVR